MSFRLLDASLLSTLRVPGLSGGSGCINTTLLPLPPYSPELNGIENLWHYLRSHCWSNRAYEHYDAFFETAANDWRKSCLEPNLIKSVYAKSYLTPRD